MNPSVLWQVTDLEKTADTLVELESRTEIAENERDAALHRLAISTPRPEPDFGSVASVLDAAGLTKLRAALDKFK